VFSGSVEPPSTLVERDEVVALKGDDLRLKQPRLVLDAHRRGGLHELHAGGRLRRADVRAGDGI
jgi:hypothetical protein